MAMKIVSMYCTGCSACESECPNDAISEKRGAFVIDASLCTECDGDFDSPQCKAACPIDDCIVKV